MQYTAARLVNTESLSVEEVVSCPICESSDSDFLFWNIDRMNRLPGKFGNVRCNNCGLIRLSPRPSLKILGRYYPEETYYSYSNHATDPRIDPDSLKEDIRRSVIQTFGYPVRVERKLVRFFSPIINRLFKKRGTYGFGDRFPRYIPNGKALDIGCGSGTYLAMLKHYGWDVHGVEFKSIAAEVAKEKYGIEVFVGNLADAKFDENQFDFISFNHSLEHIPNICEVLSETKRILKPNGLVYVEVPNVESLSQKISREFWLHWDAPRHLFSFSPTTLRQVLEISGLVDINVQTFRADFYPSDLAYELEDKIGQQLPDHVGLPIIYRIRAWLLGFITSSYYLINSQCGDFISCFARKER